MLLVLHSPPIMLNPGQVSPFHNLVWLRDGEDRVALTVEGWRSEPSVGQISFYAPRFFHEDSSEPWLWGRRVEWPTAPFEPRPAVLGGRAPDPEAFADIHAEILTGIRQGRFSKVVPFVVEELEFNEPLHWTMWPRAFEDPGSQFAFGFQVGSEGMCGITPELLFRVRGRTLTTMALAGTGPHDGPSLKADPKEAREHRIVVDQITEALHGLGSVSVGATEERVFKRIKHLHTPIEVRLRAQPDFVDLVARLHPTAALGGYPRNAALDFLRERSVERRRFGSPFGFVDGDNMTCVVAIRCLQWSGRHADLMSGCGIVEGSVADREWRELELKRRSAARQLGLEL